MQTLLLLGWPFGIVLVAWLAYSVMVSRRRDRRTRARNPLPTARRHGDADNNGMAMRRAAPPPQ